MSQLANKNYIFKDRRSFLPENKYIISEDLHRSLASGILHYKGEPSKKSHNDENLVYLLMFRVLNYDSKVIIYNYISYPTIFMETLYIFLSRRASIQSNNYTEPGKFLTILDNNISDEKPLDKFLLPNIIEKELDDICSKSFYIYTTPDILKYINKLVIYLNVPSMSLLVDLAYNRDYGGFIK